MVTNGCDDNMSGTSQVPQPADPLCATRKSAEVGHERSYAKQQTGPNVVDGSSDLCVRRAAALSPSAQALFDHLAAPA
jgi:hypothetical protein